jgi:hypothetical protein
MTVMTSYNLAMYAFLCQFYIATCQTTISGAISTTTNWQVSDSPYEITSAVVVSSGVTLTIEPGVEIRLAGCYELIVKGTLNAVGTSVNPIVWKTSTDVTSCSYDSPISFLRFAESTLTSHSIEHFNMEGFSDNSLRCIKVGQESEHNQGEKNSGVLTIAASTFKNCLLQTDGYDTNAEIYIYDSTIRSSKVHGTYPRSEKIYLMRSMIIDTNLHHDSYHKGFIIENSTMENAEFNDGCCNPGFQVKGSTISNSKSTGSRDTFGSFENTAFINVSLSDLKRTTFGNCTFDFYAKPQQSSSGCCGSSTGTVPEYHLSGQLESITNSFFKCHGEGVSYFAISISQVQYSTSTLDGVTINGCEKGIQFQSGATASVSNSQFLGISGTIIENLSDEDITASNNYWNTLDTNVINTKIEDFSENINRGTVSYTPVLASPLSTKCIEGGTYCDVNNNEIRCPNGTYCPPGSRSPRTCTIPGTICLNRHENLPSAILICKAGKICANVDTPMVDCPNTKWSFLGEYAKCDFCPDTHIYDINLNACSSDCPTGQIDAGDNTCTKCNIGKFQNLQGQESCKECSSGQYSDNKGAIGCKVCTAGYECPGNTDRLPCQLGSYQGDSGASSCKSCGGNNKYIGASSTGATVCYFVGTGYYSTGGTAETRTGQVECPSGHYCDGGVKFECGEGKFQSATGSASCISPQTGYYAFGQTTTTGVSEKQCEQGHFCENGAKKQCLEGTFNNNVGQTACSGSCQVGRSSPLGSLTASDCLQCPAGRTTAGGTACVTCDAGTYSDAAQSSCVDCPEGRTSNPGAATVNECFEKTLGSLVGVPTSASGDELSLYKIKVSLGQSPETEPVQVLVKSDKPLKCQVSLSSLTFDTNTWNIKTDLEINLGEDNKYLAKGAVSFICKITFSLISTDARYSSMPDKLLELSVTSTGCGDGEFLGKYNRNNNGTQCICSQSYYLPPVSNCIRCPPDMSICDSLGLVAPPVAKNYWRSNPESHDVETYPFYSCPFPNSCRGGNDTNNRCTNGFDDNGPVCATCKLGYVLQGQQCISCPGRTGASQFSTELLLLCLGAAALFSIAAFMFLTQPALNKHDLDNLRNEFRKLNLNFTNNKIDKKTFLQLESSLSVQQMERAFSVVDDDNSGIIEKDEWDKFLGNDDVELGMHVDQEQISVVIRQKGSGAAKKLWLENEKIIKMLQTWTLQMKDELTSADNAVNESYDLFLSKINEDEAKLISDHERPKIMDMFKDAILSLDVQSDAVEDFGNSCLRTFNNFGEMLKISALFNLNASFNTSKVLQKLDTVSETFDANVLLKAFKEQCSTEDLYVFEQDFKGSTSNSIQQIQNNMIKLKAQGAETIDFINNFICIDMPKFHVGLGSNAFGSKNLDTGSWLMKAKIFVGFAQCFAYFPVTFDIPWPENLLVLMKAMEFTAFDLYAVFGDVSCQMQTGFLQKFAYHMALFPGVLCIIAFAYLVARCFQCKLFSKYTTESLKTQAMTLLSLFSFALYTGMSTRIFRLFKCRKIQDTWYLTADYTVKCREGEWNKYAAFGALFIILYVIGIPATQFYLLFTNRKNLYADNCEDMKKQHIVQKEYGSIYENYNPACYYYDIVDLVRRLVLTGGLIMMGEESIAQIFLGIIICTMWLCLLIQKKPYKAEWDNLLAIIFAIHLNFTLVSGMSLKLYRVTPGQDAYQQAGFGIVLILVSVACIVLGIVSILASIPCLRKYFIKKKVTKIEPAVQLQKISNNGKVPVDSVAPVKEAAI